MTFSPDDAPTLDSQLAWDWADHNAFPDIQSFDGNLYGACREGTDHMSMDGEIAVIRRGSSGEWRSVTTFSEDGMDLRDPKLSVTPDGRLMCLGVIRWQDGYDEDRVAMVWFSEDGTDWSKGQHIGEPNIKIWRVTWHEGTGYAVGQSTTADKFTRLYRTDNGRDYEPIVPRLYDQDFANETTLGFNGNGRAVALCRRNRGENPTTVFGQSTPPYQDWTWEELSVLLGGPNLIRLPSHRWLAAGRVTTSDPFTGLLWLDPEESSMELAYHLPSEGDNGYPGLTIHNDQLWVVYYSSHGPKTALYESRVPIERLAG